MTKQARLPLGPGKEPTLPVRQYTAMAEEYPDAILLMRLGDFYEVIGCNAITVAELCDGVLTLRPDGSVDKSSVRGRRAMVGIPAAELDQAVRRLVRCGFKVAIAEQVGRLPRGQIARRVARVHRCDEQ